MKQVLFIAALAAVTIGCTTTSRTKPPDTEIVITLPIDTDTADYEYLASHTGVLPMQATTKAHGALENLLVFGQQATLANTPMLVLPRV